MRIVSQNEIYDFPYEESALRISGLEQTDIWEIQATCGREYGKMGRYNSKFRALSILKQLREAYRGFLTHSGNYMIDDVAFKFPE